MKSTRTALLAATFVGALLCADPLAARELQLTDVLGWESAGSAEISPDGARIVYRRTRVDAANDRRDSELWMMNSDGSDDRFLVDAWGAAWSPRGDRIAYVASGENGTAIYVIDPDDPKTAPVRLSGETSGPSQIVWSPDGRSMVFTASVAAEPAWRIEMPPPPEGGQWQDEPVVIDELHLKGSPGSYSSSHRHYFLATLDGEVRQLTHGAWSVGARWSGIPFGGAPSWTPDGETLVFDGLVAPPGDFDDMLRSKIQAFEVASGEVRALSKEDGFWRMPRVSPDGRWVAFVGHAESRDAFPVREIRLVAVDGSEERLLYRDTPDRVFAMHWAPDGKSLLVGWNFHGTTNVMRVDLEGAVTPVTRGEHRFYLGSVASDGKLAGSLSTPVLDSEVAVFDPEKGELRQLTHRQQASVGDVELGPVEDFWFESTGGTRVQGWLVKPLDFDQNRRYPLILDVHGGPDAMGGFEFDFRHHEFASRGYLVLHTNPRGSTGYGAAFANAIDQAFPGPAPHDDLMAGIDALVARGIVDESRIYAMGCSGGGSLVAWATAHTDRFAAAAVMCPVIDWIGFSGTTNASAWAYTRFARPYWEDPAAWLEHSVIMHAGAINTPTLIAQGGRDSRTPLGEAEKLFTALKVRGVDTRLLLFPNEGHGPWRGAPSNLMRLQLYLDDWFSSHVRP